MTSSNKTSQVDLEVGETHDTGQAAPTNNVSTEKDVDNLDEALDRGCSSPFVDGVPDHSLRRSTCVDGEIDEDDEVDPTSQNTQRKPRRRRRKSRRSGQPNPQTQREEKNGGTIGAATHVISLFVPVTLCMVVVVTMVNNVTSGSNGHRRLMYTPFYNEPKDISSKLWQSAVNSTAIVCVVIFMTFVMLFLYKKNFNRLLRGWLITTTIIMLFIFSYLYFDQILRAYNIPMDLITAYIFVWNFGVVGLFCVQWKGPLLVQQGYLICISSMLALLIITHLPDWTAWGMLCILVVWDLVAVLCPKGPLRMLIEEAENRNEPVFPALIYSSTMVWLITTSIDGENITSTKKLEKHNETGGESTDDSENTEEDEDYGVSNENFDFDADFETKDDILAFGDVNTSNENGHPSQATDGGTGEAVIDSPNPPRRRSRRRSSRKASHAVVEKTVEDDGMKLGLGDFIFYGVLVGKASYNSDWNTTLACFVAILIGLCCTLLLLAIFRKALPALPISLSFGLVFYIATSNVVQPFMDSLASKQIYI